MDRDSACAYQIENPRQTTVALLPDLQDAARFLTKKDEHTDERDEQRFISIVKRRMDEYAFGIRCAHLDVFTSEGESLPVWKFDQLCRVPSRLRRPPSRAVPRGE